MKLIAKIIKDKRGTTAVTVAVAMPMMLAAIGAAVDVSMAVTARTDLAHLAKVACTRQATAGARGFSNNDQIQLTAATVSSHMRDMLLEPATTRFDLRPANGTAITVNAQSRVETTFMKVFGIDDFDIAVTEECNYQLQIPTIEPNTSCDATIPTSSAGGSFNINLNQARDDWRNHNENCASGSCVRPPAPDEMIVTVYDRNDNIIERNLLTSDPARGDSLVRYAGLPSGSQTTVQPVNGFPWQLPEACMIAPPPPPPPTINPPPSTNPPPTTSSGGSCGPTGAPVNGTNTQVTGSGGTGSGGSSAGTGSTGSGFNTGGGSIGSFNGSSGNTTTTSSSSTGANGGTNTVSGCVNVQNGSGNMNMGSTTTSSGGSASGGITASCSGASCSMSGTSTTSVSNNP